MITQQITRLQNDVLRLIYIQFIEKREKLQMIQLRSLTNSILETEYLNRVDWLNRAQLTSRESFAMTLKPTPYFPPSAGNCKKPKIVPPNSAESAGSVSQDTLTRFENMLVVARVCDLHPANFMMNLKERRFLYPII